VTADVDPPIQAPPFDLKPTPGPALIRRLLLLVTVVSVVLGVASLRHAILLRGRIDPDLVTTPDAAQMDTIAIVARVALLLLVVGLAVAVRPWIRGVRDQLGRLWELGVIGSAVPTADGGLRRVPGARSPRLLVAPVALPTDRRWWITSVADSSRSAAFALGFAAVALGLVTVGSLALVAAGSREVASDLLLLVGVGGFLLVPACGLLAWLVADIERREAAAISVADPARQLPPEAEDRWAAAAIGLLVALAFAVPSIALAVEAESGCVATELDCRWMVVQADQLSSDPRGATTRLHYGLQRATGARLGTLVLATGGPGVSGMAAWETSKDYLDPRLTGAYDIVSFDSRGVGQSGFRDCPVASEAYADTLSFRADASVVDGYVTSCLAESGVDPGDLAMYASAQVAEDIETIRQDLGVERIVLYGESYGTAVAEHYALAHPDRLEALILDAPLDIAQSTDESWTEAAVAFEDILERTFRYCGLDVLCANDLPDPDAAFGRVMKRLQGGSVNARFADSSGSMATWEIRESDALATFSNGMYDEYGRSQILLALAAADRDDWVPLARLVTSGEQLLPYEDSVSDFTYYATSCADRVVADEDARDVRSYLEAARASAVSSARLGSVFLSGAACHAWPLAPASPPSASLPESATFPVFVLTASADPVTPAAIARRLAERYSATTDVYLIETTDGSHVTFGRGETCPDHFILDYLVDGRRPGVDQLTCPGELVFAYTGLVVQEPGEDAASYHARALDAELLSHPDYNGWDGTGELAIGCRFGGRMVVTAAAAADKISLQGCAVIEGDPMTGTGQYREDGTVRFDVTSPRGEFRYELTEDGDWELQGTFDGRPIPSGG
jgi:pimeloyl-ACP methyl ester carboxylesterase